MTTSLNRAAVAGLCLTMLASPVLAATPPIAPATAPANSCTLIELLIVIAITDSSGRVISKTTTDAMGNFRLPEPPPGDYQLKIDAASLNKALASGGAGPEGAPGIIAVLIALLLPASPVKPLASTQVTFKRGTTDIPGVRFMVPAGPVKDGAITGSLKLLK